MPLPHDDTEGLQGKYGLPSDSQGCGQSCFREHGFWQGVHDCGGHFVSQEGKRQSHQLPLQLAKNNRLEQASPVNRVRMVFTISNSSCFFRFQKLLDPSPETFGLEDWALIYLISCNVAYMVVRNVAAHNVAAHNVAVRNVAVRNVART